METHIRIFAILMAGMWAIIIGMILAAPSERPSVTVHCSAERRVCMWDEEDEDAEVEVDVIWHGDINE